jgi:hypothetical protein
VSEQKAGLCECGGEARSDIQCPYCRCDEQAKRIAEMEKLEARQHERARYWEREAWAFLRELEERREEVRWRDPEYEPPPDEVLLGERASSGRVDLVSGSWMLGHPGEWNRWRLLGPLPGEQP